MIEILIGGLFALLFGGMLLILFLGARPIEDEFDEKAAAAHKARADAARIPRFFVVTQPASPPAARVDEGLLRQLQRYLEAEQNLADQFVSQPSIESLYRESGRKLMAH